jgi:Tol biopolymer transport system component
MNGRSYVVLPSAARRRRSERGSVRETKLVAVALAVVAVLAVGSPAEATAPGSDGLLATAYGADLATMEPDGSNITIVFAPAEGAELSVVNTLDWSPDGTQIAFALCCKGNKGHIYVIGADGSGIQRITPGTVDAFNPSWSPDGTKIAYSSITKKRRTLITSIHVVNADGTNDVRLTSGPEPQGVEPAWSPDGSQIAFIENTVVGRRRSSRLEVMSADGTTFRFLFAAHEQLFQPSWSPDAGTIVFGRYSADYLNSEIWQIGSDGASLTQLTDTPKIEMDPAFSPEGSRLVFIRSDIVKVAPRTFEEREDVVIAEADGSNATRISTPENEGSVSWQSI